MHSLSLFSFSYHRIAEADYKETDLLYLMVP